MNAKEMLQYWSEVRAGLNQALGQFGDEELEFRPRENLWSLGQVARHIANTEDGWFGYVAWRKYPEWPPDLTAEDAPTVGSIQARLREAHARTEDFLAPLSEVDLEQVIRAPWGDEFPLKWVVWHVLEHEIHHRGEIYLMLGMLGREAPDV
jgi:uncharacterized damage-inducible protein DinB